MSDRRYGIDAFNVQEAVEKIRLELRKPLMKFVITEVQHDVGVGGRHIYTLKEKK